MHTKIEMCVSEIKELAAWVERNNLQAEHHVVIEQESGGGIGVSTQARCRNNNNEGIFIDITDYDLW